MLCGREVRAQCPGTIIVTGVVNAGGTEKPGRAIDGATFASGSFRIDHSVGQPTVRFDPAVSLSFNLRVPAVP